MLINCCHFDEFARRNLFAYTDFSFVEMTLKKVFFLKIISVRVWNPFRGNAVI